MLIHLGGMKFTQRKALGAVLRSTIRQCIRSVGVRGCDLVNAACPVQMDLFVDEARRDKLHKLDATVDVIRKRFGFDSIQRGLMYMDRGLSGVNAKEDHTVHPHGYFEAGNKTGVELYQLA